ncbi:AbrB/MazE/SpoVT family DNA-binding domain-containing protein [Sphingomonas sp. dw_22]|uniref:AbrB/MazE/SpoVT family DNA-binding domain-containing protein n=1 Tax=Sphingomonas sp. dw_22 TaxID=2721175 RepID=UPI0031FEDC3C
MIAGGKIVIPAELRRELDIKDGDSLVIERDDQGNLVLKTYAQVVREVQAAFRAMVGPYEGSLVDELIAERRREAAMEDEQEEALRAKIGKRR